VETCDEFSACIRSLHLSVLRLHPHSGLISIYRYLRSAFVAISPSIWLMLFSF